jgi:hypothetical protein
MESIVNSIKYLHRLQNLSEQDNPILRKAFAECQKLKSTQSWFNNLKSLLQKAGISLSLVARLNIRLVIQKLKYFLKDEFLAGWKNDLFRDNRGRDHGNKLRTYRLFKNSFAKEDYLTECKNKRDRQQFSVLRLSAHNLQIEKDRYTSKDRLPPELRLCKHCDLNVCEDEFHFIIRCPMYNLLRQNLFAKISQMYPSFQGLADQDKFIWLMANVDPHILHLFTAYISACFSLRRAS